VVKAKKSKAGSRLAPLYCSIKSRIARGWGTSVNKPALHSWAGHSLGCAISGEALMQRPLDDQSRTRNVVTL